MVGCVSDLLAGAGRYFLGTLRFHQRSVANQTTAWRFPIDAIIANAQRIGHQLTL